MTANEFPNPGLFDEAYVNALARQEARSAAIGAADYATILLKHSKVYCRKPRMGDLITEVQHAIYQSLLPAKDDQAQQMCELVSDISSQNVAQHFLRAWKKRAPQITSAIEAHGLYSVGLAALSQSKPGDSVVAICELLCMINTWNAGELAHGKSDAASFARKPENEFVKTIIVNMGKNRESGFGQPSIPAMDIWNEAKRQNNYTVPFNKKFFNFSSGIKNGNLHVDFFETDKKGVDLEKEPKHASWTYDQFESLVGKIKLKINSGNNDFPADQPPTPLVEP